MKNNIKKITKLTMIIAVFATMIFSSIAPVKATSFLDKFTTATIGAKTTGSGGTTPIAVFEYTTTSGQIVYCLERDINFVAGREFNKSELINDYGLMHVMSNVYPHKKFTDSTGAELPKGHQVWISQVMIWEYLYQTKAANNTSTTSNSLESIKDINKLLTGDTITDEVTYSKSLYELYMKEILEKAYTIKEPNPSVNMETTSKYMTLSSDGKYYMSSAINITTSDSGTYGLKVEGPTGTQIVDKDGKVVTTGMPSQVFIKIPVDSVTETNKKITLTATGDAKAYEGYYYKATGAQTIAFVDTKDIGVDIPITLEIKAPDTAIDVSNSTYVIGALIIAIGAFAVINSNRKKTSRR